jgi:hypothetical protein
MSSQSQVLSALLPVLLFAAVARKQLKERGRRGGAQEDDDIEGERQQGATCTVAAEEATVESWGVEDVPPGLHARHEGPNQRGKN